MEQQPRHAFISYIRENKEEVDELQEVLEAAGVKVWRDTQDLWPGEDWAAKIREAIQSNSLAFIACFSSAVERREKSYQFEELTLAAEEYRLRQPTTSWLFTVRFDETEVPHFDLGAGRTLARTIHRSDLFGRRKMPEAMRLAASVARIVNPQSAVTTSVAAAADATDRGNRQSVDTFKQLLRDPTADIALEDFVRDLMAPVREALVDEERFPLSTGIEDSWAFYEAWRTQLEDYEAAIAPVLEYVRLAATYGRAEHNPAWLRIMRDVSAPLRRDGGGHQRALVALRAYPALLVLQTAAVAAVARGNFLPLLAFAVEPRVEHRYPGQPLVPLLFAANCRLVEGEQRVLASLLAVSDGGTAATAQELKALENGGGKRHTPISDHLRHVLRRLFADELPRETEYEDAFDRAEVILDAVAADLARGGIAGRQNRGGFGAYTWRYEHSDEPIERKVFNEASSASASWKPVLDGLFGGDRERASAALAAVGEVAEAIRRQQW